MTMAPISPAERPLWTAGARFAGEFGGKSGAEPAGGVCGRLIGRMKRGSIRVWLLSDLTAVIGIAWRVWPLMIMVISAGRRAMLGEQISPRVNACIMHMLPIAEAHLPYAPCRRPGAPSARTCAR